MVSSYSVQFAVSIVIRKIQHIPRVAAFWLTNYVNVRVVTGRS